MLGTNEKRKEILALPSPPLTQNLKEKKNKAL